MSSNGVNVNSTRPKGLQSKGSQRDSVTLNGVQPRDTQSNGPVQTTPLPLSLLRIGAARLLSISRSTVSSEVYKKATLCILDFIGAAHGGTANPLGQSVLKYAANNVGFPVATAFGMETKVCASTAVFLNTILAHRYAPTLNDPVHVWRTQPDEDV